ncbi:MAG: proton-conducting transporter membrane subunit [Candidatus Krumholzibacteria bacterium]|jgi:multicomponent Na+:H+ antiporter subunit D|nr:proton-conducting transporter membrane subunit [Candidatus Krumholzibacteria bacterium]
MMTSHIPLLIPATFLLAALLIPLAALLWRRLSWLLAVAATGLCFFYAVKGLAHVTTAGRLHYHLAGWQPPFGIEFVLDPLSAFFCVFVTGVALLALIHAGRVVAHEVSGVDMGFYSLAMLLLAGLSGMVVTGDLFNLYVFLEISALASYALIARGDPRAPLSAFRYLTLGTTGAAFYLLGLAFIYMSVGSLNLADVSRLLPEVSDTRPVLLGLSLMVLGMGLKVALFPLHAWLADAYTHASSAATALIAPIGTKVAAYVLLRLMFFLVDPQYLRDQTPLPAIVGCLGAAGMLWGSIMAMCQKELKRMLAYSSVAQVGYIALGIGLASPLGFIGAVLHALNHACMKACLFLVTGNFRVRLGHSTLPRLVDDLRRTMPWSAAAFTAAAISMVGLPPLAGFFSKWYLVLGSIQQSNWVFVAVLVASSLLNAVYFFRVLERMYLTPLAPPGDADVSAAAAAREAPASMLAPTLVLAGALLVLGVFNAWIVSTFINPMIPSRLGW